MDKEKYNDELLNEILMSLSTIDEDTQPSPQFHSNLMQRLRAESDEVVAVPATDTSVKEVETKMGQKSFWQKVREGLKNRQLGYWAPVTVGACALVLVVSLGLNDLIDTSKRSEAYDTAPQSSEASPPMPMPDKLRSTTKFGVSAGGAAVNEEAGPAGTMDYASTENQSKEIMPILPPDDSGTVPPTEQTQKMIYNGNLGLEVDRYDTTVQAIKQAVQGAGGYIVSEQRYNLDDKGRLAGDLSLRIPYQQFNELLNQTGALGKVTFQNTSARDVTTEFVDVEARLKVMAAKENRLLELLSKTGSLTDVLAVEQELANTRAELESLKGRLRYLTNQTDYSTLNVSIQEKPLAASEIQISGLAGLWLRIKEAFMLGINGFLSGIGNLVVWLVKSIPAMVIAGLAIWLVWLKFLKKWWQKRRNP